MQSYSRAVVKSFLPLLVFAILIFPAIESKAGEGVPQHPVLIDTSQPGILVFDASENRTLLPLLDDVRKFPDLQTYRDFIHTTFNYEPHHELKGATSLSVVQYGTLYSLSKDLSSLIEVTDPVATLIGGRYGKVIVEGTEYCVDPDRCDEPVDPHSLLPLSFSISKTFWPDGKESLNSDPIIHAAADKEEPFLVESDLNHERWGEFLFSDGPGTLEQTYVRVQTTASVTQVSGGFYHLPILVVDSYECHYLPNSDMCFLLPVLVQANSGGENSLYVSLDEFYATRMDQGLCKGVSHPVLLQERGFNVPKVKVQHNFNYMGPAYALHGWEQYRPLIYPERISGSFLAWDIAAYLPDAYAVQKGVMDLYILSHLPCQ